MAQISKITLPSGNTYDLKDATARADIETIRTAVSGGVSFLGVTTTPLTDGSTVSTITVNGTTMSAINGCLVMKDNEEYVWADVDSQWHRLGPAGTFKALAYKDSATGTVTPSGTVSRPTFTGTPTTITVEGSAAGGVNISTASGTANYTPAGSVSQPTFSGAAATIKTNGTPNGSVTIGTGSGTANYTPAGTVSQPTFNGAAATIKTNGTPNGSVSIGTGSGTANYTPAGSVSTNITVTPSTTTVNSITAVGTLPTCTLPTWQGSVANENLTIAWTAGSFNQGTLPTKGSNTTVATGIQSQSASSTFTGTGTELKATFSGSATTFSGSYTPGGTVSQPTFSGAGTELKATFSGSATTFSGSYTPDGTVSKPTFSGTGTRLTGSLSDTNLSATATYTPAGTVSQPTFTGNAATITVS